MIRQLDRMTYDEVEAYLSGGRKTVILPIGATEQHGVHGALGTDTFAAYAVGKRLAAKADALLAPALPYGLSENHRHFPGYCGISAQTLSAVLTELTVAFIEQGFRTVLLLSGHRGNDPATAISASDARGRIRDAGIEDAHVLHMSYQDANRGRLREVVLDPSRVRDIDVAYGSDGHGGSVECSIAMTVAPDGFRLDKLAAPDSTLADARRGLSFKPVLDIEEMTDDGIFGSPVGMSMELGEQLVEMTAQKISDDLQEYTRLFGQKTSE